MLKISKLQKFICLQYIVTVTNVHNHFLYIFPGKTGIVDLEASLHFLRHIKFRFPTGESIRNGSLAEHFSHSDVGAHVISHVLWKGYPLLSAGGNHKLSLRLLKRASHQSCPQL